MASRCEVNPVARSDAILPGSCIVSLAQFGREELMTHLVYDTKENEEEGKDDQFSNPAEIGF
jgi:hypothetical protein